MYLQTPASCSVIFKGGTSLSKAHRIIWRFSEDVDLVVVLPEGGKGARDSTLKTFVAAAESTTGVQGTVAPSSATTGAKRTATFAFEECCHRVHELAELL